MANEKCFIWERYFIVLFIFPSLILILKIIILNLNSEDTYLTTKFEFKSSKYKITGCLLNKAVAFNSICKVIMQNARLEKILNSVDVVFHLLKESVQILSYLTKFKLMKGQIKEQQKYSKKGIEIYDQDEKVFSTNKLMAFIGVTEKEKNSGWKRLEMT